MNNSVFGKTIEKSEKRVDYRLVTSEEQALKLAAKPDERYTIFDEKLVGIHMRKKIFHNKPMYHGMYILHLSKSLMYNFHYKYL